jgi:hypothetical protein
MVFALVTFICSVLILRHTKITKILILILKSVFIASIGLVEWIDSQTKQSESFLSAP